MAIAGKESENGVYEFPYFRPEKKPKWEAFKETLWNPEKNAFLGRNAKSWAQIIIFYTIFYIVLAALFSLCMQVLFLTLKDDRPKWTLDGSLIGTNPGVGFRPISPRTEEGSLIWYDAKNATSIKKWTNLLDEFLELYRHRDKLPGGGRNQVQCNFEQGADTGKVCMVDLQTFGPCSPEEGYGFRTSSPCVFLKINRIFDWQPDYYDDPDVLPAEMPKELTEHIRNVSSSERKQIWISCEGENPADKENLRNGLEYYPTRGIPGYYYPYTNAQGYLSPLVAVRVLHPQEGVIVNIECRAWAKNIQYHGGNHQREGSIRFNIMID